MKLPMSLHARVAFIALVTAGVTLAVTTYSIVDLITWVVSDNMDVALDTQIHMLDQAVLPNGRLDTKKVAGLQLIGKPAPGWGWQVMSRAGHWQINFPETPIVFPMPRIHPEDGIYSGYVADRSIKVLHVRRLTLAEPSGPVTITVVSPAQLIEAPLQRVRNAVYRSQILVLLLLLVASFVQLHFGLKPLRRFAKAMAGIRSGEAQVLTGTQPAELEPFATELNALIARNNASLEAARLNAANLAHAVKTPLSSLMLQLEHENASAESKAIVAHISQRVAHHLRRSRSGALGLGGRVRADAHEVVEQIRPVLASLQSDNGVLIENKVPPTCFVAVDAEDLGEMLGNLLENACRYARERVVVTADTEGETISLSIEDDGPGIPDRQLATVLQPGVRLDEVGEGYGLGLALVRELIELYGGSLRLNRSSSLGGLKATLITPGKS